MKFNLDHKPQKSDFKISHDDLIFMVGSCFTENIGQLLEQHKFKVHINPKGITFNPASILDCLETIVEPEDGEDFYFLERDGVHLSYLYHSSINASTAEELLQKTIAIKKEGILKLKKCKVLIITFGTAVSYIHRKLECVVANCHKQPQDQFEKYLQNVDTIAGGFSNLINKIKPINPDLKIIFTVSPVKYLKDGLEVNNLSKSILRLAIHQIIEKHDNCYYFPAFELVNDDLRDYRFYKKDLAHPNELAIEYVWEKFSETFFNANILSLNREIQKLNQALAHRKLHDSSAETKKLEEFILKQKAEILKLNASIQF